MGIVDNHGQDERYACGNAARPLCREVPFDPEMTLLPRLRVRGYKRDEQDALLDLAANFRIPFVAMLEAAGGIEPNLRIDGAESFANFAIS